MGPSPRDLLHFSIHRLLQFSTLLMCLLIDLECQCGQLHLDLHLDGDPCWVYDYRAPLACYSQLWLWPLQ